MLCMLSLAHARTRCLPPARSQAECACDICEGHLEHGQLAAAMQRSVFCLVLPSNTQSSRRLTEAMLTGERVDRGEKVGSERGQGACSD